MERQVPIYFNDVSFSPIVPINNLPNIGQSKVRVFYKYRNRNGSYISDEVADMLIKSTEGGVIPIVGFFDVEGQDFTSHVPQDLACGYGYCDQFLGWEKAVDLDGREREYATFSVKLFTNYFEAANKIIGNPQSMELDRNSIQGDWVRMDDGEEYYVYKTARMRGFTVLGKNVEPCFEGAAFFSHDTKQTQFEKFSLLLTELQEKVREADSNKGGEKAMIFNIPGVENEKYSTLFGLLNANFDEEHNFEVNEIVYEMNETSAFTFSCADKKQREYSYSVDEEGNMTYEVVHEFAYDGELETNYASLQENYNTLTADHESTVADFTAAKENITALEEKIAAFEAEKAEAETANAEVKANFEAQITELNEKLAAYEAQIQAVEDAKKDALVESYEKVIPSEEIDSIRAGLKDFNYDELEQKLAVCFARNSLKETSRIPNNSDNQDSSFAKLMANYKR